MSSRRSSLLLMVPVMVLAALGVVAVGVAAQTARAPTDQASPVHPPVALLDDDGQNVLESGGAVSTLNTCGQCHDTAYIQQHNSHLSAGTNMEGANWDPVLYRTVTRGGERQADLDEAGWLQAFGQRTSGGELTEINCFLCHLDQPDNAARVAALESGAYEWANTATLAATGVVAAGPGGWQWNQAAFDEHGELSQATLRLQDPADANCALCHAAAGSASGDAAPLPEQTAVNVVACELDSAQPATTGQFFSPDLVAASGLNLAGKESLARAWDVHAERSVQCTACHFAPNNPVHDRTGAPEAAEHLFFDPRRLELGEYVQRPSHDFGDSAQCTDCHAEGVGHDWLPYADQHMEALACETCHVPQVYAPALQQVDWTVLNSAAQPRTVCRGTAGDTGTARDLITGYSPTVLARGTGEGAPLAPYNLVTAWYWEFDDAGGQARPIDWAALDRAYFTAEGVYAPEVLRAFDADGDGKLSVTELVVDSAVKEEVVAERLAAQGLANVRITGQVVPYALNHTVTSGEWAISDCRTCHSDGSRLAEPMALAAVMPGGEPPRFAGEADAHPLGTLAVIDGRLQFTPDASLGGRYVFGLDRAGWADWLGALAFLGVLAGVTLHGGLRVYGAARAPHNSPRIRRVYMYTVYERFWHWLQMFTIVLLLGTGLVIHRPDLFSVFSFRHVVVVHNVVAVILVANAALALFYHLASGEIRQYLPRPYGFFDQAIRQAQFYLRGIFQGRPHPFEKTPAHKLNPLQQITYVAILNVLLPLQVLTGALMWGAQQWPDLAAKLGGLPLLAPIHSLAAWLFGAFIVAHVYLTTTGHAPLAGFNAMVNGWEDVDAHAAGQEVEDHEHTDSHGTAPDAPHAAAP